LVNAVKALASKVSETAHLIITTLTAHRVETDELCLKDGSGTSCYTRSRAMLGVAAADAATAGSGGSAGAPGGLPTDGVAVGSASSTTPAVDEQAIADNLVEDPEPADAPALGEGGGAPAEDAGQSSQPTTAETPAAVPQNTPAPPEPANDNHPSGPGPLPTPNRWLKPALHNPRIVQHS
jgi:hypothetical protein